MARPRRSWTILIIAGLCGLALALQWISTPLAEPLISPLQDYWHYLPLINNGQADPQPTPTPNPNAIIVDHRAPLGFPDMPDFARLGAIQTRLLVRHASVGSNISDGLDCLGGDYPTIPGCESYTPGTFDRSSWDFQNRGNPGWQAKIDDFVAATSASSGAYDAFSMKFCYIDALGDASPSWEAYRVALLQLEAAYPDKTIIWWTIPLTSGGNPGADRFNELVRQYAREHGKVLFDIADIEAHDPDGNYLTNPAGDEILFAGYTEDGGHLNWPGRIRVAQAFWVLLARLNGWFW
jgi:hypothetical protein